MIYNFEALPDRKTSESIKWHYYEEDVLPMWVADMDFVSPEPVIRALQERAAHGVFGYPGEVDGLRQIIVERLSSLYDWQVAPEDLVFIPGVVTGISMAAHAVVGSDSLLIQPPVYMPFLSIHHNTGGARQDAQLVCDSDGNYAIDWDVFESAINDQTRMFLMSNPHNPVGRVFTAEELQRMAEICLRRGLVICSDEIHCDLVFSGHRHIPVASLSPEIAQQTITLMAPSKTFNIAGCPVHLP